MNTNYSPRVFRVLRWVQLTQLGDDEPLPTEVRINYGEGPPITHEPVRRYRPRMVKNWASFLLKKGLIEGGHGWYRLTGPGQHVLNQVRKDAPASKVEPHATASIAEPDPPPRASVDVGKLVAILDGVSYDVESKQALLWLKVLLEVPGQWISGAELSGKELELDGIRTDKLKKYLKPTPFLEMIESKSGTGSRLNLPPQ